MIPTEDNYVDWILLGVKEYFRRIDYKVRTYSIGQVKEKQCPVDRILAVGNKIIGLQFKRPVSKERPWRYERTPHQHEMISHSRWIFYCFPDFIDLRLQEVALYHCKFVNAAESKTSSISGEQYYYRWGAFADALISCLEGLEIGENTSIEQLIADMVKNPHDTYLSLNKRYEEAYIMRNIAPPVEMEREPA
ncbi:MAG: hypothetical protein ONB44_19410 [candidate division KSB1 bacterium]|nr:hypothetical protein [candidate division KSB1 bacterium]